MRMGCYWSLLLRWQALLLDSLSLGHRAMSVSIPGSRLSSRSRPDRRHHIGLRCSVTSRSSCGVTSTVTRQIRNAMLLLLLILVLVSVPSTSACEATVGVQSCILTPIRACLHSYQLYGGTWRQCHAIAAPNGTLQCIIVGTTPCTPYCNGTAFIANCSSAPASYCLNYYSTDSGGSYQCGLTTAGLCGLPQSKYYCDPTHSIQCVGNQGWAWNSPGCAGATTQADCQTRWMINLGQKNQCEWDATYGFCYMGVPCHY